MGHSAPRGADRLERGVASVAGRSAGNREDRKHAVADEFEHFAAEGVHGAGDAVEPGVEGRDDLGRRTALGQSGEAAQVGEQKRRFDRLANSAPKRAGQHLRRAASAEIGLERRVQGRARRERRKRRRREARRLAQAVGLVRGEGMRSDPPEPLAVRDKPNNVFMHGAAREACKPAPAVACRAIGSHRSVGAGHESQGLDHLIAVGAPQPGASRNQRVGRSERERPTGERRAVLNETQAEGREEELGRRRLGRRIDQPSEGCREGHGVDHRPDTPRLSLAFRRVLRLRD